MSQLLSGLAVGTRIKFGKYQVYNETPASIVWQIAKKTDTQITLVTENIIDCRCFDAKEYNNMDGTGRNEYGNNRYKYSNIRHYLNRGAGGYVSQYQYDAPPDNANISDGTMGYSTKDGFLTNFSIDEVNSILDTVRHPFLPKPDVVDANTTETVTDKVFLLTQWEVSPGGSGLDLFQNSGQSGSVSSKALKTLSPQCSAQVSALGGYATRKYMLDYPYGTTSTSGTQIDVVPISGTAIGTAYAYENVGLVVATNIAVTTKVSNAMDSDSCYPVVFDVASVAPTINIADQDLGGISVGFSTTYQVNDGNPDDSLTITEDFVDANGNVLKNIRTTNNAVRNTDYTMNIASIWDTISVGVNRIRIKVEDNGGNSVSKTITFTKQVHLVVTGLDTADYGSRYEPFVINYEVFGTDKVYITETIDGNQVNSIVYNGATPGTSIKRKIDLTDMVTWYIPEGTAPHTISVEVSQVNAAYPTGEFITKNLAFTVIPRPETGNYVPVIEIPQTSFGEVINGFTFYWTIKDANVGNSMNTIAKLDGSEIYNASYVGDVTNEMQHHMDLSVIWNSIAIGSHTIEITCTDGIATPASEYITFTKKRDKLDVIFYGFVTDKLCTRITPVVNMNILQESLDTYNVYACNNAADQNPTWESIDYVPKGKAYTFINKTKVATYGRVAIKIVSNPYS